MIKLDLTRQLYKPFLFPIAAFLIVVILTGTLGKFLLDQILKNRNEISELQAKNSILEKKKEILSSSTDDQLSQYLQASIRAIPPENPGLLALSTIRSLAAERGISTSNLKLTLAGPAFADSKAKTVGIDFDITADTGIAFGFLEAIKSSTPLMRVTETSFNINGTTSTVSLKVAAPWETVPDKLGAVDSPIEDLSEADKEVLTNLSSLHVPQSNQIISPPAQGRTNPFSL